MKKLSNKASCLCGGVQLQTNYSFNEKTNLFFNTSAKKTNSKQETYSLNIGFKSIF